MKKILQTLRRSRLWKETKGQDLIEYSLLVSFFVVVAAAAVPGSISAPLQQIFGRVVEVMALAP